MRHLRSRGLQPIHRRSVRISKVRLAAATLVARSPSVASIAHYTRLHALLIRTGREAAQLLLLLLGHASPPTLLLYHPFLESLPNICEHPKSAKRDRILKQKQEKKVTHAISEVN